MGEARRRKLAGDTTQKPKKQLSQEEIRDAVRKGVRIGMSHVMADYRQMIKRM